MSDEHEDTESTEEEEQEAPSTRGSAAGSDDDDVAFQQGVQTLGIERWVQFGFISLFAVAMWLFDKIVTLIWDRFAEPDSVIVLAISALLGIALTVFVYKNPKSNAFCHEAAAELSKVTWPDRKETWSNTVVVVITSVISAVILFGFDAAWSWVTGLIYPS